MNKPNNRTIRTIVATGSLVAIIIMGIPWVDEYLRLSREAAELVDLESQLADSQAQDLQLSRIETKLSTELDALAARSINPDKVDAVREILIEIVRAAGGRVRRLEIADGEVRPWAVENDDPRSGSMPLYGEESGFVLHTHAVELQADGSLETVRKIIAEIGSQDWLLTTKGLTTRPSGVSDSMVSLELKLVLYGLTAKQHQSDDDEFEGELARHTGVFGYR